jgi:hypothetical protein
MSKILSTFIILGVITFAFAQEAKAEEIEHVHCCFKTRIDGSLENVAKCHEGKGFAKYMDKGECKVQGGIEF